MQSILERGVKKEKLRKGVHSPYLKAKFKTKMLILVTIFRILRNQEICLSWVHVAPLTLIVQRPVLGKLVEGHTFLRTKLSFIWATGYTNLELSLWPKWCAYMSISGSIEDFSTTYPSVEETMLWITKRFFPQNILWK